MLTPTAVLYPEAESDDDLVGDVDWATGIVRMHVPYDEWRRVIGSDVETLNDDERFVLEVITHEGAHVMQMVTTGYAWELSLRCFEQVVGALNEQGDLDAIYHGRAGYAAALEPSFATLTAKGEAGVRPIDILEGAAFLMQKRTHYPNLGPRSYQSMLDEQAPDAAYRRAYDATTEVLGEDAFDHFPHIANLSLQAREPQTVFMPLVHAFRAKASRVDLEHNHGVALELLNSQFADLLLGHPMERLEKGRVHPLLVGVVLAQNELAGSGRLSPIVMLASPYTISQDVANLLAGPTLFPPTKSEPRAGLYIPNAWAERAGENPAFDPAHMRLYSAVSALILQDIEPVPLERPRVSAWQAGYDMGVTVRNWTFSRENMTIATLDRFGENMRKIRARRDDTRMLRGCVAISFPDEEYEDSPYAYPDVRRFVRGLYDRVPWLLYYLVESPQAASVLGCLAAHAPDDGVHLSDEGGIAVQLDAPVVAALLVCVHEAVELAREVGDDPRFLLAHARGLPAAVAEPFERVVDAGLSA